jgi:hypothetical protein
MGNMPCFLGEFGLPFDINGARAYKTGNYRLHEEAISMYYDAIDRHLLHSTIWNYTVDNTHEAGDGWNGEDLSIYHQGEGRALKGWLRPYPMAIAGIPLELKWDLKQGIFRFRYRSDPDIDASTEIFAPPECFGLSPRLAIRISPRGADSFRPEIRYIPDEKRIFIDNKGYRGDLEIKISL